MKIGIIAGSGFYDMDGLKHVGDESIETPYGAPSDSYKKYLYNGVELFFLPRHGARHNIAPHKVNYRANIDGFAQIGVSSIFSFAAVGGINRGFETGSVVIPDNGIDMTSCRENTFFDDEEIVHVDLTSPFCPDLRRRLLEAALKVGIPVHSNGVYICTNGPRLETAAEIAMFDRLGADIVGMTLFPECTLARERGICYATMAVVTNPAAGIAGKKLTSDEVVSMMGSATGRLKQVFKEVLDTASATAKQCICNKSLDGARISKG